MPLLAAGENIHEVILIAEYILSPYLSITCMEMPIG